MTSPDWQLKSIREIVATPVTDGPHSTPRFLPDGVPFLSVNNLVDGRIDWTDVRYISRSDHELFSKKTRPRHGDILIGKAASVGRVAYLDTNREVNIWSPIALIRVRPHYDGKFVYYQLQSPDTVRQIALLTNTSSQGNIGMGDIERIGVAIPPLSEQRKISRLLADGDEQITTLEKLIAKKRAIKQGMMQELLTGRSRLPGFDTEWEQSSLGALARVVGGGTPSTRVPNYWGGGIPWFAPAEIEAGGSGLVARSERTITSEGLASSAARLLPAGTVLVTSRASIGNCAVAAVPVSTNQGIASLVPQSPRSTWFLYHWIQKNKSELVSRAAGSTFLEISARRLAAIPLCAPSLDEQAAIGSALRDTDGELGALMRRLEAARNVKQGMMQELLTGRTRLGVGGDAA